MQRRYVSGGEGAEEEGRRDDQVEPEPWVHGAAIYRRLHEQARILPQHHQRGYGNASLWPMSELLHLILFYTFLPKC